MPPLYFVWFARPALIIQRRLFYGTSFIATCVHDSPQLCWGFGIVSIIVILSTYTKLCPTKPYIFVPLGNQPMPTPFWKQAFYATYRSPRLCRMDVHKNLSPSTPPLLTSKALPFIRKKRFATFNSNLKTYQDWLLRNGCSEVCMGSTSSLFYYVYPSTLRLYTILVSIPLLKLLP